MSSVFLHILPAFFMLLFFCPCPLWHFEAYLLSFIWHSKRPQEWRHAPCDIWPHFCSHWLILSLFDCSCHCFPPDSPVSFRLAERRMQFFPVTLFLCMWVFLFMKVYTVSKWSEWDTKCTECSKQVGKLGKSAGALIFVVPYMPLSPQAERRFLPPPITV